ncbi:MAG: hypothetical protein KA297_26125 [Kofleriaceae bacterium]|jgi:hypothetical protein|nr:hypothetical protein [Kofleriaceae bacterium]
MLQRDATGGARTTRPRSPGRHVLAAVLGLAAAAGCGSGGGATGDCEVLCSDDRECPSGLVCGAGARCVGDRAATCDGVGVDGPVDGRLCGTHDEDRDGLADGCDPCPHAAADSGDDADQDGVAIGCDPNDSAAGDVIVLFDGLPGNTVYQQSPGWRVDVDQHRVETVGAPDLAWLTWRVPGIGERFKLTAEVEVRSRGASLQPWLGLGRGLGGTINQDAAGFVCRIDLTPIPDMPQVRATRLPTNDLDGQAAAAEVPLGRRYSLNYESSAFSSQCRFTLLEGPASDLIAENSGNVSDDLGLIVHGADLVVHWFQVTRINRP